MQQHFIPPEPTTIDSRRIRLMGISCGLLLAALEIGFILNMIYFHIYNFQMDITTFIGVASLLYFVAPIPLSFYVARQTSDVLEGRKGGSTTVCTGALLTTLGAGIYYIWLIASESIGRWGFLVFVLLLFFALAHLIGALIGQLGAIVGSRLGVIGQNPALVKNRNWI